MSETIPRRFNEDAVARYADTMRHLCACWPTPITVNPHPLSKETFRSRFRDAMKGVVHYEQGDPELRGALMKLNDEVTVSEAGTMLVIGPTTALRKRSTKPVKAGQLVSGIATLADNESAVIGPDSAIIKALATLLAAGILADARISGVSEEFIYACFPEDYEGGVVQNQDGTFTIY